MGAQAKQSPQIEHLSYPYRASDKAIALKLASKKVAYLKTDSALPWLFSCSTKTFAPIMLRGVCHVASFCDSDSLHGVGVRITGSWADSGFQNPMNPMNPMDPMDRR